MKSKKQLSKSEPGLKTSRKERRKKFSRWVDMDFLHSQTGKSRPVGGCAEYTNLICDKCGKKVSHLKSAYDANGDVTLLMCDKCRENNGKEKKEKV